MLTNLLRDCITSPINRFAALPGVYPGTWQQQILGSSGTRIATITPLAGTERSAGTGHQAISLQLSEHYSEQFLYPGK